MMLRKVGNLSRARDRYLIALKPHYQRHLQAPPIPIHNPDPKHNPNHNPNPYINVQRTYTSLCRRICHQISANPIHVHRRLLYVLVPTLQSFSQPALNYSNNDSNSNSRAYGVGFFMGSQRGSALTCTGGSTSSSRTFGSASGKGDDRNAGDNNSSDGSINNSIDNDKDKSSSSSSRGCDSTNITSSSDNNDSESGNKPRLSVELGVDSGKDFKPSEHDKYYASMGAQYKEVHHTDPSTFPSASSVEGGGEARGGHSSDESGTHLNPNLKLNLNLNHAAGVGGDGSYPWRAASALGSALLKSPEELNRYYAQMESSLMRRINESNKRRFRIGFIASVVFMIWVWKMYGEQIKETVKAKFFGIAQKTLENESLKIQTQELAMAVVQTILNDENIAAHAASFLKTACQSEETKRALLDLTLHVLQHKETEKELMVLIRKLVNAASVDKDVLEKITQLFVTAVADERIRASFSLLVRALCEDEEVILASSVLAEKVFTKQQVIDATVDLLSGSTERVFKKEEVILKSRDFVADVMGDDAIQREGGDAIWNSVSHALTPGIRRIGGICLIGASGALIKLCLSPY